MSKSLARFSVLSVKIDLGARRLTQILQDVIVYAIQ